MQLKAHIKFQQFILILEIHLYQGFSALRLETIESRNAL